MKLAISGLIDVLVEGKLLQKWASNTANRYDYTFIPFCRYLIPLLKSADVR